MATTKKIGEREDSTASDLREPLLDTEAKYITPKGPTYENK